MKLYKDTSNPNDSFDPMLRYSDPHSVRFTVGIIVSKKVDDFNEDIKVYQPIAELEMTKIRLIKDSDYCVSICDNREPFKYISQCKIEDANEEERRAVIDALNRHISIHLDSVTDMKKLLSILEEK